MSNHRGSYYKEFMTVIRQSAFISCFWAEIAHTKRNLLLMSVITPHKAKKKKTKQKQKEHLKF